MQFCMSSPKSSKDVFISLSDGAKSLWAKSPKDDAAEYWLPLIVHMSDSAKVGRLIWREWIPSATQKLIADGIGGLAESDDRFEYGEKLLIFLAAAHDIGKAIPAFQYGSSLQYANNGWIEMQRNAIEGAGLPLRSDLSEPNRIHHSFASEMILERNGFNQSTAVVLGGHHGKPPSDDDYEVIDAYPSNTGFRNKEWCEVQDELLTFAVSLSDSDIKKLRAIKNSITNQVILTGLVIMIDWIASGESLFPYIKESFCTDKDFAGRAEHAWSELDLPKKWEAEKHWISHDLYEERFKFSTHKLSARPIQRLVEEVAKDMKSQGMMVIEAPMGEGKTEAALVASEIFAEKFGMGGLFFALPTQATADGIFLRMKDWIEKVSAYAGNRSLFLAHGKSAYNKEYDKIKKNTYIIHGTDKEGIARDNVIVHEWFSGRKKGLLSDFVIGTVDQILMGGLKQRHLAMRHLALSNKVIIIDEVHAYDAYMGSYLTKVLQWLGAYKVPVILLSATLPQSRRENLISAYLGNKSFERDEPQTSDDSYPLITYTDDKKIKQKSAEASGRRLTVNITKADDRSFYDIMDDLTDEGGYVGIIVNTVKKAQKLAKDMAAKYGEENIRLLHSRFVSIERTMKEKELREMLSDKKRRTPSRRMFIIGTQVMEQSLDLDFDLLVTDLCPTDLLLQRIGRLHRHNNSRPKKLREARCIVLDTEDGNFDSGSEAIYLKYHLMNARRLLPEKLHLPDDIRDMVEQAYSSDGIEMPSEYQIEYQSARKEMNSLISIKEEKARAFQIKEPKQGQHSLIGWLDRSKDDDSKDRIGEATVRDTEGSIEVILIQEREGRFHMLQLNDKMSGKEIPVSGTPEPEMCFTLAGCKVALPHFFSVPWRLEKTIRELEKDNTHRLPECWQESHWLAGELFLILDENNTAVLSGQKIIYDNRLGLRMEDAE